MVQPSSPDESADGTGDAGTTTTDSGGSDEEQNAVTSPRNDYFKVTQCSPDGTAVVGAWNCNSDCTECEDTDSAERMDHRTCAQEGDGEESFDYLIYLECEGAG